MKTSGNDSSGPDVCLSAIRELAAALACVAVLLLHGLTSASAGDVAVREAWSRATPKGAQVAAGYLTIENRADSTDRLLSASTPAAGKVEIHEMLETDAVMRMRPMKEGLTIPPNGKLVFAPGGTHLMFLELKAPFTEGEHVPLALEFEKAGQVNISLEIGGVGAKGPQPGAADGAVRSRASADDSFFTHIHDPKVMANVTISPGRSGPVEVTVQLEDAQEHGLAAEALSVTLSNSDKGVPSITTSAERVASDTWHARMFVSRAGRWNLALGIAVAPKERIDIAAPVLIE